MFAGKGRDQDLGHLPIEKAWKLRTAYLASYESTAVLVAPEQPSAQPEGSSEARTEGEGSDEGSSEGWVEVESSEEDEMVLEP